MRIPNAFRAESVRIPFASIYVRHSTSLHDKISGPKAPSIVAVCTAPGRLEKRMSRYAAVIGGGF